MNRSDLSEAIQRPLKVNADGRTPSEHEEQRAVVEWFRKSFRPMRIFAIPNGGARFKSEAGKLKAEGVSAGVPDLFIPELLLWIEMKRRKGGRVDEKQKEWHEYIHGIGQNVMVCYGADDAKEKVLDFIESAISNYESLENGGLSPS